MASHRVRAQQLQKHYERAVHQIRVLLSSDPHMPLWRIVDALNAEGLCTSRGNPFHEMAVLRLLQKDGRRNRSGPPKRTNWRKGLTAEQQEVFSDRLNARIIAMCQDGQPTKTIAKRLRVSVTMVNIRIADLVNTGELKASQVPPARRARTRVQQTQRIPR